MAQQEQGAPGDAWARVKSRLRAELGEDVFASWFRGIEVEQVDGEVVHLTVATRFLRNWLRSHYYDFVLRLSRAEWPDVERVEFRVRQPHFGADIPKEPPRLRRSPEPPAAEVGAAAAALARPAMAASRARRSIRGSVSRVSWSEFPTASLTPRRRRWRARSRLLSRCSIPCSCTAMWASAKPTCCTPSPGT